MEKFLMLQDSYLEVVSRVRIKFDAGNCEPTDLFIFQRRWNIAAIQQIKENTMKFYEIIIWIRLNLDGVIQ